VSESEFNKILSAPHDQRLAFLQDLFERAAKVDPKGRLVVLPVSSFVLLNLIRLLRELNVPVYVFGTEPISVAVSVDYAAKVPLFDPEAKSRKYKRVVALAAERQDPSPGGPVS